MDWKTMWSYEHHIIIEFSIVFLFSTHLTVINWHLISSETHWISLQSFVNGNEKWEITFSQRITS